MRQNDRCPQKLSSFRLLRCSSFIAQVIILSDPRAGAIRAGSELTVLCCLVSWGWDVEPWMVQVEGFLLELFSSIQGDHWLFSNHCFCIRYRNIFKLTSKIRKESLSFTVKSVSSWPVIAIARSKSYWKLLHSGRYNHLSLHHRVSYSEQKVVLSSRLGNASENDINFVWGWSHTIKLTHSGHTAQVLCAFDELLSRTDRRTGGGVQGILRGTAWFMVAFWTCCVFFNLQLFI